MQDRNGSRRRRTDTSDLTPAVVSVEPAAHLILAGGAAVGGRVGGERLVPLVEAVEIGRRPAAAGRRRVLVLDDERVSARHARITSEQGRFEVRDLQSRNGTLLDGRLVEGPTALHEGAHLFLGGSAAVFRLLSHEAATAIEEDLRSPLGPVPTASGSTALALRRLRLMATAADEVLIVGETGAGKEVYGRAVHAASRRGGPFMAVNCAALPGELVESELFGYRRGAHSQAIRDKPGLIEQADGGTLFLDEIGDMSPAAQAKLLRFLQDREVLPLGATRPRRIDVRVIAAAGSTDPASSLPTVRRDLVARLATAPIRLPPLRERLEDVGALARHFLGDAAVRFSASSFLALFLHDWPGNVRELQKTIREALILADGQPVIESGHLPASLATRSPPHRAIRRRSPRPAPTHAELVALLRTRDGRIADVARDLDRRWPVVWRWLRRYGLQAAAFRRPDDSAPG
jgi:DNA-binding NtrC family response regulator